MSKRDERLLLKDILDAGNKIVKFTEKMNFQQFAEDDKTQDACIRRLQRPDPLLNKPSNLS